MNIPIPAPVENLMEDLFGIRLSRRNSREERTRQAHLNLEQERRNLLSARSDFFIREAYKTLRTNVNFALAGESKSKVMIITSAMQSEGKSFTALNLAISFAMAEKHVIIVDCDLRRPKLARLLNLQAKQGLSEVLLDADLLSDAIHPSRRHENLDCIVSGAIPPNPSELLGSARMERVMSELREKYDYIVLDCPPLNMVTDAMVLAPRSDGVLFVVRAEQSEKGPVTHAVEQLQYANIKILGFVLNGVNMEGGAYGYGKYRYRYHYGYRRGYGYGGYGYSRGYGYGGYGYGYGYGEENMPQNREAPAEKRENI